MQELVDAVNSTDCDGYEAGAYTRPLFSST